MASAKAARPRSAKHASRPSHAPRIAWSVNGRECSADIRRISAGTPGYFMLMKTLTKTLVDTESPDIPLVDPESNPAISPEPDPDAHPDPTEPDPDETRA